MEILHCLTFSQELSPHTPGSITGNGSQSKGGVERRHPPPRENAIGKPGRRSPLSLKDNVLFVKLKEERGVSMDELTDDFPERSRGLCKECYWTKLTREGYREGSGGGLEKL